MLKCSLNHAKHCIAWVPPVFMSAYVTGMKDGAAGPFPSSGRDSWVIWVPIHKPRPPPNL